MAKDCALSADWGRRHIQERVRALRAQLAPARAQSVDGIHDLRVASRRLRVALGEHRRLAPAEVRREVQQRVRQVTQLLGRARELDVMIAQLKARREDLRSLPRLAINHAIGELRGLREEAAGNCEMAVTLLQGEEFDEALLALFAALRPVSNCCLKAARRRLRQRWKRLFTEYHAWKESPSDEALHEIRIRCKKVRYACELYAEVHGAEMEAFIQELKAAQQTLGAWNDFRVLRDELALLGQHAPRQTAQGYPALLSLCDAEIAGNKDAFEAQAAKFFTDARRKAGQALFGHATISCCRESG